MAAVWSLATLGSAVSAGYGELMLSRIFIGVGEAAYGSVGLAVVLAVFPAYRRASFTGAFMAGGSFGSVIGVALGGTLAVQFGWRWSFAVMAIIGLVLTALYAVMVSDKKLARYRVDDLADGEPVSRSGERAKLRTLFSTPAVICAYIGSGLQLFIAGSLFAWLPSYLGRAYGMPADKAAGIAAIAILFMGAGMILLGMVTDRLSRRVAIRKWTTAIAYALITLVCLGIGFSLPAGGPQLLLLAIGIFFAAGTTGPAGAMVSNLTAESIRATAFGTLTLANNLLGLAAGPLVVGILADRLGLGTAMQIVPLVGVGALVFLVLGRRLYPASLERVSAQGLR
jgi:predicted MFS family arabinose efflux permease